MGRILTFNPLLRAVFVVGAVAAIVGGVTYAALDSSSASLTGNTVSSATADLRVSTNGDTFGASRAGFNFDGVVPGGDPAPADGEAFWLRNTGTFDLALTATITTLPTTDPGDLALDNVHVIITDPGVDETLDGIDDTVVLSESVSDLSLAELAVLGDLAPGDKKLFIQVSMDADTFEGTSGTVDDFDLVFNGTNALEVEVSEE